MLLLLVLLVRALQTLFELPELRGQVSVDALVPSALATEKSKQRALAHTAGFGSRLIFGSDDKEPTVEEVQAAFRR